jgi:hypothetical protein
MPFSNYTLRRTFGFIWKWEANFRDEASARGFRFSRNAARMSARGWLQNQGMRRGQAAEDAGPGPPPAKGPWDGRS